MRLGLLVFGCGLLLLVWVRPVGDSLRKSGLAAVAGIRTIHTAEVEYQSEHGRYGGLRDLGADGAGLISSDLALGLTAGYRFTLRLDARGYVITAMPLNNTDPSFYSDQTMVVRRGTAGSPANLSSPELR